LSTTTTTKCSAICCNTSDYAVTLDNFEIELIAIVQFQFGLVQFEIPICCNTTKCSQNNCDML